MKSSVFSTTSHSSSANFCCLNASLMLPSLTFGFLNHCFRTARTTSGFGKNLRRRLKKASVHTVSTQITLS